MSNLVSIVLPVHNGEKYLHKSIASVLEQTYSNWELLIIDDCSSDCSAEIAKEYAAKDIRIHYYHNEKNLKLPRTLNRGFALSSGEYLTWTSDDNIYLPNALEKMVAVLDREPSIGFVFADYYVIDEEENIIHEYSIPSNYADQIVGTNVVGACFMYRRDVYETVGDYQHGLLYVEDYDYWQRIFACYSVDCIHEYLYKYRVHKQSLSSRTKIEVINNHFEKTIKRNVVLFPRLNLAQKYYYYYGIYRCCQSGKRRGVLRYWIYRFIYNTPHQVCGKIKRVFRFV